jgi:hypothetical protein
MYSCFLPLVQPIYEFRATLADTLSLPVSRRRGRFAGRGAFFSPNRIRIGPPACKRNGGAAIQPVSTALYGGRCGRCLLRPDILSPSFPPAPPTAATKFCRGKLLPPPKLIDQLVRRREKMSGSSSIGRGGGQIGRAGSSRGAGGDDDKARKRRSDTAMLRGSYRYMKYGLTPPLAFSKREARTNRGGGSPASASASTSHSRYHAGSLASASTAALSTAAPPRMRMEGGRGRLGAGDRGEDHRARGLRQRCRPPPTSSASSSITGAWLRRKRRSGRRRRGCRRPSSMPWTPTMTTTSRSRKSGHRRIPCL